MGSASKVVSMILRLGQAISAIILLGILGSFASKVNDAASLADGRLIYAIVVASLGLFFSLVFLPPFTYSFMGFPLDFVMFVLSLVAFCLLEALTGINTCNAVWYYSYWGYYWGGFWRNPSIVVTNPSTINYAGCGAWRAVLGWMFIMSMGFLVSSFLGAYVILRYREEKKRAHGIVNGLPGISKGPTPVVEVRPVSNGHSATPTEV